MFVTCRGFWKLTRIVYSSQIFHLAVEVFLAFYASVVSARSSMNNGNCGRLTLLSLHSTSVAQFFEPSSFAEQIYKSSVFQLALMNADDEGAASILGSCATFW